jgi:hypothetical protein
MEHIKITIEIKRYICEKCGQSFQSGYILNKHKKECTCEGHEIDKPMTKADFKLKINDAIDKALKQFIIN